MDKGSVLLDKRDRTLYFFLLFFFATLYTPVTPVPNGVCMWLLFVYTFFYSSFSEKWQLLKQRKEIIIILLFYLLNCISGLLSENRHEGISWMGIRIALFAMPFAIGTIYIKPALKERLLYAFATVTAIAAIASLVWGVIRSVRLQDASLLYNDSLSEALNLQSIYFSMLINLAIFSYIYLLVKDSRFINRNSLLIIILLLFITHFLLASRIAIIILYSSILIFSLAHIIRQKKVLEGITLALGLFIGGIFLFKVFPKTINRFKELTYTQFNYTSTGPESHYNMAVSADQWNGANIREAVWQCVWIVIKKHALLGVGLGDKLDELKKEYARKGFEFGIRTNRNTHNNYLDIWLSMGLVGLVIFVTGFTIIPMIKAIKDNDWLGIVILAAFIISMIPETYMDRTAGNVLLGFFSAFIAAYKKPRLPVKGNQ